ncbi:c-type cytochrome biogenesis protein CcmI [Rhodoferax sp.]|jgi:cytochrome c-type biogenesis protein CcmH|uniref:c-type cytochrome biogenesis protein CcmI n=1 Tax=Rhodoferax sp. TaxID=50421 RepID=UPI0037834C46
MTTTLQALKAQLQQLNDQQAAGALSPAQYEQSKAQLERRILELVVGDGEAAPRTPMRLLVLVTVFVLAVAVGGYAWKRGQGPMVEVAESAEGAEAGAVSAEQQAASDQIVAMVDKLAQRLKEQPGDAEGWTMLARSYSVMGRNDDAIDAYAKAIALRKDDASLMADYADALALKNNRNLDGEPMVWVERALKLDPKNLKALALAGVYAYDRKDYAGAIKQWEKVVQYGAPDNPFVVQFGPAIAEARAQAGLPPAAPANVPAPSAANAKTASPVAGASVSGRVVLSAALAAQAQPQDTVFVFARPASGTGMPLAVLRKQVKDLPFEFKLDDSMAMSPANALSGAGSVVVSARISKSGNAFPQPGDLMGQTAPVAVGAQGLQITIDQAVKP